MRIELEVGDNLKTMLNDFCWYCDNKYSLGSEVRTAFGLDFGDIVDKLIKSYSKEELKEIIIKVE